MSTHYMSFVLRICDRLFDKNSPECIDRQGQITQATVLVLIFHLIMATAFLKMQEYELKHHKVTRNSINISFSLEDFSAPKLQLKEAEVTQPQPLSLLAGKTKDPGSGTGPACRAEKVSVPIPQSAQRDDNPRPDPMRSRELKNTRLVEANKTANDSTFASSSKQNSANNGSHTADNVMIHPGSGVPIESGNVMQQGDAVGGVGIGTDGNGPAAEGAGDGKTQAPVGSIPLSLKAKEPMLKAMGAIGPYHRALMQQIAEAWKPAQRGLSLTVNLLIARDGTLLSSSIVSSSGNRRADNQAIATIESLTFRPLPEWFKGEDLLFQIDLTSE